MSQKRTSSSFLRFIGPGYIVAVGYMDPGNWATDIGSGSGFGYRLLSVVVLSGLIAMFFQALSAKLGLVTGKDLAQLCGERYKKSARISLWIAAEIAIIACDLAEVIGAAIALNLLFHVPIAWGVWITGADVMLLLLLQNKGFRWLEALVILLVSTVAIVFVLETWFAKPIWSEVASGLIPRPEVITNPAMLFLSVGIVGATIMPHNLYLHSALVQSRRPAESEAMPSAIKNSIWDSNIALLIATFVNGAILIVAASAFYHSGHQDVASIEDASRILSPVVGVALASPLFAIALLAAGQNSTITGTLAGQIVMEGFIHFRLPQWQRRMISRGLAIIPASLVVVLSGESGIAKLLLLSQVVLSVQLIFALVPLVLFTSDRGLMDRYRNHWLTNKLAWGLTLFLAGLNLYLVYRYSRG